MPTYIILKCHIVPEEVEIMLQVNISGLEKYDDEEVQTNWKPEQSDIR